MGFNRLLHQLTMTKQVFRKEMKRLKREGYIEKKTRKNSGLEVKLGPGRPEQPYSLTKKGTDYLALIKNLEDLRSNLFLLMGSGEITYKQYVQKRKDAYKQLGIPYPKIDQLDFFAEQVRKLHPNTIMLLETLDGRPRCTEFIKPFYVVKKEKMKGFPGTTYLTKEELPESRTVIEPTGAVPVEAKPDAKLNSCTTIEELAKVLRTRQHSLE